MSENNNSSVITSVRSISLPVALVLGILLAGFLLSTSPQVYAADARTCRGICLMDIDDLVDGVTSIDCTQEIMAPRSAFLNLIGNNSFPVVGVTTHICYDEFIALLGANGPLNGLRSTFAQHVPPINGGNCYPYPEDSPFTNSTQCGGTLVFDDPVCPAGHELQGNRCIPEEVNPAAEMGQPRTSCPAFPSSEAPIYFASGNKYLENTDYQGTGINALALKRYYNSIDGQWRFNYGQSIRTINGLEVQIVRPDGRTIRAHENLLTGDYTTHADDGYEIEYDEIGDTYTVRSRSDVVEVYDGVTGNLSSSTNRAGQTTMFTYANDLLVSVVDHTGKALTFVHDANNRISSVTDPAGNTIEYTYDGNGSLEFVIYPDDTPSNNSDNPRIQYHYEDANNTSLVTGMTDELGLRYTTYAYDSSGRAILSERAGSVESTSVVYNADDTVSVTNALGKQANYTFVLDNSVRKMSQMDGQATALCNATATSIAYDANGFIDTMVDENGNTTDLAYNDRGLVESRTEASGTPAARTTTTTWHADFRVPTQIVRPGQTVDMTYDTAGRLLTRTVTDTQSQTVPYATAGQSRTTTYTYNSFGLIATMDGPRTDVSDVTTYTYDANGDLASVTNPLGQVTEITARDARGLPTQLEDANNVVTALAYDARGRLTSRTVQSTQGNAVTTFVYDDASQLTSVTLPDGVAINYEYDDAHRMVAVENDLGERMEYTLDNAGNPTAEVTRDAGSGIVRSMTRLYDELSRLREEVGAQAQTASLDYDLNDNLTHIEDPLLNDTAQAFDALDRLITITDSLTNDTSLDYDDRDNLLQVTDPRGIATNYVYDGLNNLIQEESGDAGTSVHLYDAAGNRTQTTDGRGVVSQFAYDALGRMVSVTYPANPSENVTYVYDTGASGVGRLASITDHSGSTAYTYDDRGNTLTETRVVGSAPAYVTSYGYDLANKMTSTTYPSGRVVSYGHDAEGRVDTVTTQTTASSAVENLVTNVSYLPFGPPTGWTYGNGSTAARSFDQDYRLTDLVVSTAGGAAQLDRDYTYDDVNNITDIDNLLDATRSQSFSYDVLYRLHRCQRYLWQLSILASMKSAIERLGRWMAQLSIPTPTCWTATDCLL